MNCQVARQAVHTGTSQRGEFSRFTQAGGGSGLPRVGSLLGHAWTQSILLEGPGVEIWTNSPLWLGQICLPLRADHLYVNFKRVLSSWLPLLEITVEICRDFQPALRTFPKRMSFSSVEVFK